MIRYKYSAASDTLTAYLTGRIDTVNAGAVEQELEAVRSERPCGRIELDCSELTFISSAGLRVILRLKKSVPELSLINVSPNVYEVFEVTGFTEMMEVRKACRVLSTEGFELIGSGANGSVYRAGRETVVKVYPADCSPEDIQRERELARMAFVLGIPTAIPYDVVRIEGGGYGSVYELLDASSLAELIAEGGMGVDEAAYRCAELIRLIHSTEADTAKAPSIKEQTLIRARRIKPLLSDAEHARLMELIEAVPEDAHMIHGDLHIKNVMLQNGECLLIDMDTIGYGHPVFEFGAMYCAYVGYPELDRATTMRFLGVDHSVGTALWEKILGLLYGDEARVREVEAKAAVPGTVRIMDHYMRHFGEQPEKAAAEIENCRLRLQRLLGTLSELSF